jgi:hypothetical protein
MKQLPPHRHFGQVSQQPNLAHIYLGGGTDPGCFRLVLRSIGQENMPSVRTVDLQPGVDYIVK